MLLGFFLNTVFSQPTKPNGWEKRTDAKPYITTSVDGIPQQAEPLGDRATSPGWDVHVRTSPGKGKDDWRARVSVTAVPMTFRSHIRVWPSDDWVYYQMLGRIKLRPGRYQFGVSFVTADAGIGCFTDIRIGGVTVTQADTVRFFSQRKPKSTERDEITLTGGLVATAGDYDAVVTLGCHPGKMGGEIERARLDAWKSSKFALVIQPPGESLRLLRGSEVVHIQ